MPFEYDGTKQTPDEQVPAGSEIVKLNPNHSHYICVDNGTAGQFGVETSIRSELETFMACFDNDARRMSIEELTQYFTACMDESALNIGGNPCVTAREFLCKNEDSSTENDDPSMILFNTNEDSSIEN